MPLYLEYRGLNAAQIGIVMAVAQGMRIFGPTVWGWLADHTSERVRILHFTSVAAAICFLPVLFPGGFGYVLLTMFAVHFFMTGQVPIAEAMTATQLRDDPQAAARYGRLRAWGSISFVVVVLATGVALDWVGVGLQPWLVLVLLAATAVAGQLVRDAPHAPHGAVAVSVRALAAEPRVRWFFLSVLLMIFAHGALYTYFSLHLAALGYSNSAIGVFWVLGVIVEIGFFFLQGRVFARFDPFRLLAASFALAALRFALIARVRARDIAAGRRAGAARRHLRRAPQCIDSDHPALVPRQRHGSRPGAVRERRLRRGRDGRQPAGGLAVVGVRRLCRLPVEQRGGVAGLAGGAAGPRARRRASVRAKPRPDRFGPCDARSDR